jgi:hypothetical protein
MSPEMRSHAGMAKQTRGRRKSPPLVRPLVGWLVGHSGSGVGFSSSIAVTNRDLINTL